MYFLFSYEFRSFKAFSANHHVNNNWRSVWVKMFAIRGWADEGVLISFSKCSSTNFTHVRPSWLLNSNLFTSAFCCLAQFRRFLDTPRSSFFRQFSSFSIVSRAIHQEGALFLVNPFSRGSFLICCPTLWCWLKCCMKQHIASSSGTHASFFPELQCVTWVQIFQCNSSQEPREKKTDTQSGWKGLPSGVGQMRVGSSGSWSTPAAISPTFALVGSSNSTYLPLLSRFLFHDLDSLFGSVDTIITEVAYFFRPSSLDHCLCCSLASNNFFPSLDLGKTIFFSYDNLFISITHFGLKFLSQSKAVFTEFGLAVWPLFSDMDHLAKHILSLLTSSQFSIGSPNATTLSHSSFLNSSTSLFRFMIWLNSSKNFAILLDPQYSRT